MKRYLGYQVGEEFEEVIDGKITKVKCVEDEDFDPTKPCKNCIFWDKEDDSCFSQTVQGCAIKDKITGRTVHFEEVR